RRVLFRSVLLMAGLVQEPARVLRADRGAGARRPRDQAAGRSGRLARALPRGRPYGALRAHVAVALGGGAPAGRQRGHRGLGDAARAPDDRSGLADATSRLPPPERVRSRGRDAAALARPPLLREADLRAR